MKVLAKHGVLIGQPTVHHLNPGFISSISVFNKTEGFLGRGQSDKVYEAHIYVIGQERSGPYVLSEEEYNRILPELTQLTWWQ